MKKQISLLGISILLFSSFVTPTFAQETVFSDDFSGDLSKWQPIRDDGRFWSISNQALQALIPFGSVISELVPTTQSWKPVKNYTFELDFTPEQGADKNISFGVIDKNNWYELHFTPDHTGLAKVKNGTVIWSQTYPYVLKNAVTHRISTTFIDGKITVSISGFKVIDVVDPTFSQELGKIALKASTGSIFPTKIKIDNVVVKEIKDQQESHDTKLGVELLKQSDPAWGNAEYDTATTWAKSLKVGTTVKDWGCNLISLLMVLHYHNIYTFADNSPITPQSLNTWLMQNHGYYDSPNTGNINKNSISQLTASISEKKGTPKLEFTYTSENILEAAVAEIEKGNPVILELDGHFVVADGFTADKKDLFIKDPAYDVSKLSEHPLPLKSLRLYTPSQTDLSYISIVSDLDTEVKLTSADQAIDDTYVEKLRAFSKKTEAVIGPKVKLTEIAKPEDGTYIIELRSNSNKHKRASIISYAVDGAVQNFELTTNQAKYKLQYQKSGKSSLETENDDQLTYSEFRKTIKQLSVSGQIKQEYLKKVLLELLKPIEILPTKNQRKLLAVIKIIVANSPKSIITNPAKSLLLDQVKLLMASLI